MERKILSRCIFFSIVWFFSQPLWAVTFEEQAERLQLIYAHLIDFRPNTAPVLPPTYRWQVGGDLLWIPSIDNRVGQKTEKVAPPSLIPRPRGRYFHTSGGFIGFSWIPPVSVQNYTLNLPAIEIGYRDVYHSVRFGLRAHYSHGSAKGPMTDSSTEDEFRFNRWGSDVSIGYPYQLWTPYVGGGTGQLNTELKIEIDGVKMEIDQHSYSYYFIGTSYTVNQQIFINFEQYRTESFLEHLALSVNYSF